MSADVTGFCPMGCGRTLFLGIGGYVTCRLDKCPNPSAASDILGEWETEHLVTFDERGFTVKHPLRERIKDELLTCALHRHCADLDGPPAQPGTYRAVRVKDTWRFLRQP